jgi:hypothetical protein
VLQPRQQRQRHVTVSDGLAERARGRAFGVDVDPLVVTGRVGKQVDVLLADGHPVALPDGLARSGGEVGD